MPEHGPEFERENMKLGLALFGLFVVLVAAHLRGRLHLPRRLLSEPEGIFLARPPDAGRGDSAGGQGPVRHGRAGHDLRLDPVRRPRPARDAPRRCGGSRRPATRTSARPTCTSSPTGRPRRTSTSARCRTRAIPAASRAARAAAPRRRSRPGSPTRRSAPTPAARSASRRPAAASTGFKPTWGLVPIDGCFPLAPSYDHAGPMARDVDGCERMLQALVPGFEPTEVELEDVEVGVAWTELADPLVRARVEAAAERFPRRRRLELPLARRLLRLLQPRGRRRPPRALRRARRLLRRERPRRRSSGASPSPTPSTSGRASDASATASSSPRRRPGVDLVLTPTLVCVAPTGAGRRARAAGPPDQADLPVQRDGLAGGGDPLRARRGRSARLGAARGSARRRTPSCSAAAKALERALSRD